MPTQYDEPPTTLLNRTVPAVFVKAGEPVEKAANWLRPTAVDLPPFVTIAPRRSTLSPCGGLRSVQSTHSLKLSARQCQLPTAVPPFTEELATEQVQRRMPRTAYSKLKRQYACRVHASQPKWAGSRIGRASHVASAVPSIPAPAD